MQSTITAEQRELILTALAEGDSAEAAARKAATSRRSIGRLRQADEAFALDYDDARQAGCEMIEQRIVRIARGEDEATHTSLTACFGILRARLPLIWREKAEPPKPARPAARFNLKNLSTEELEDLERILQQAERAS